MKRGCVFVFLLMIGLTSAAISDNCSDVALLYHFDGNTVDDSGNGNDGSVSGAVFGSGKLGQGAVFDGVDDYIDLATNELKITSSMSFGGWFKPSGLGKNNEYVLSWDAGSPEPYAINIDQEGSEGISVMVRSTSEGVVRITKSQNLENQWYHIFGVTDFSEGKFSLYLDGQLIDSVSLSGNISYTSWGEQRLLLGHDPERDFFNGTMDEIMIYGRALTASEVSELYNSGDGIFVTCGECVPSCAGKICGSDGCGGSCGSCSSGYECSGGNCVVQADCIDGETQSCSTGQPGICSEGTETCFSGNWEGCTRNDDPTAEICGNGIDEDCSGEDLACEENETSTYQCSDSVDNDGDGAVDFPADIGCSSAMDNNETNEVIISEFHSADLNEDGCVNQTELVGYLDLWFAGTPGITIELVGGVISIWQAGCESACIPSVEICDNGIDEDCDGSDLDCPAVNGSWQEILEAEGFDIVETFDELEDWTGSYGGPGAGAVSIQEDMPNKINGDDSIWQYYSFYGTEYNHTWIGNHGSENVWGGTGKSLVIDYNQGTGFVSKKGPSRLGFKIGYSPDDGYANEVYVFHMNKYNKAFFPTSENDFLYHQFLKTLDVSTGFRTVREWGTEEEHSWLENNGGSTQALNEYGLNYFVMNFFTGGSTDFREKGMYNSFISLLNGTHYEASYTGVASGVDYSDSILNNEWFAIEYHFVKSNPAGASNGLVEIWAYDKDGNSIGYDKKDNLITFRNGNSEFNHSFNKFVWGGNRHYTGFTKGENDCTESHVYLDDIIVDDQKIAEKYFSLLNG